jgi:predicted RNase H-like nuclease
MSETVVGVDGCRGAWIVAELELATGKVTLKRVAFLETLFESAGQPRVVAIDMPIGLPDRSGPRGRTPERLVRRLLGARQSSVFSIPSRSAVYASLDQSVAEVDRFRHCCSVARATSAESKGVSKQGFGIFQKIVAIDGWLRSAPHLVERVFECHPEVSFWAMNGKQPVPEPKKLKHRPHAAGLERRRRLLSDNGLDCGFASSELARQLGAGEDDLIDACAACWTAARIARGEAISFPDPPERDSEGLTMAIWA